MARVVCLNDYETYSHMVGAMLEKPGHKVKSEIAPISVENIVAFKPDVIVLTLVRKLETISAGGMTNFYRDVEGARALKDLLETPELKEFPYIITSIAVLESELPPEVTGYKAFLEVPQKLDALLGAIERVAANRKHGGHIIKE